MMLFVVVTVPMTTFNRVTKIYLCLCSRYDRIIIIKKKEVKSSGLVIGIQLPKYGGKVY